MSKINNYTSADAMPVKLLSNYEVIKTMREQGVITPIHAQLIPTNKCNLKCSFCSCGEDDRDTEMSLIDVYSISYILFEAGCKSVTITGGGEPTLHPEINEIIEAFFNLNIEVGIVSNGLALDKLYSDILNRVTWCRISDGDFRNFTNTYKNKLLRIVGECPDVDWAFSYVVSEGPNLEKIADMVEFANLNNFTHIRLVSDLFNTENVDLDSIRMYLKEKGIDDSIVVYQGRKNPEQGGDCYICYLKPLIGADCQLYNCCGVQYALEKPTKNLPKELSLGSVFDLESILIKSNRAFDGSICHKCYYMNYNRVLAGLLTDIKHEKFI